jgi:hypothetical protein
MALQIGTLTGTFAAALAQGGDRNFATRAVAVLPLDVHGIPGDRHHGPLRRAGPREPWLPRGLTIRNDRQLTALGVGDLALIATALGVEAVPPELIGANLVISGLDSFSSIAPGSRLAFGGNWGGKGAFDGTAVLRVEGFNHPCRGPGRQLAAQFGRPELEFAFVKAAKRLRGLILSVDAPGRITPGDVVVLVPPVTAPFLTTSLTQPVVSNPAS